VYLLQLCGESDMGDVEERCSEVVEVFVVKATDVAKLLSEPPAGDDVLQRFGKIFEEEYALANHIYNWAGYMHIPRWFARKVAARLRAEGIYRRDLVVKAYRAYSALLSAGVVGEKPRTAFRRLENSLYISAQPDLYDENSETYYEFKLYPINNYARKQAEVFAWVIGKPVVLIGLREEPNGYLRVEKEVINPPEKLEININELKKLAVVEEFCKDLEVPVYQYERDYEKYLRYQYFSESLEEEDEDLHNNESPF